MMKAEQKVLDYIRMQRLFRDGETVVVALSGGADSVCLLLMLHSLGYDCHAVHCNFHLRGEESDRDEKFVTKLCIEHDIPLYKTDFDTAEYASRHGISIEMAARDLRYAYFTEVAGQVGAIAVCVGHHRDDNVETFLLNAVRGTGITGLCGIRSSRRAGAHTIVRPLLCLSRKDIVAWLDAQGQSFVTDSTNLIDDVSRNKIRLNIIPQLQSINPAVMDSITTTIDNLTEVERVYKFAIANDIRRCQVSSGRLSIEELFKSVSPSSVLHEWLADSGFNRTQEQDILHASTVGQSGKLFISETDRLLVDREHIIIESLQHFPQPEDVSMAVLPRCEVTVTVNPHRAYLDAVKVRGKLHVRTAQPSDSFQPFGMKGRKLLSEFPYRPQA